MCVFFPSPVFCLRVSRFLMRAFLLRTHLGSEHLWRLFQARPADRMWRLSCGAASFYASWNQGNRRWRRKSNASLGDNKLERKKKKSYYSLLLLVQNFYTGWTGTFSKSLKWLSLKIYSIFSNSEAIFVIFSLWNYENNLDFSLPSKDRGRSWPRDSLFHMDFLAAFFENSRIEKTKLYLLN